MKQFRKLVIRKKINYIACIMPNLLDCPVIDVGYSEFWGSTKRESACYLYCQRLNPLCWFTYFVIDFTYKNQMWAIFIMMTKPKLTVGLLCKEASIFASQESNHFDPALYGVTDGKAIGTYLEHKFQQFLHVNYEYIEGSSAKGIDFPELEVDMKVTRITQPQSSCPFKSAQQKIYGLGYSLLVFVYDKTDAPEDLVGALNILHTAYIEKHRTADYQTTSGLIKLLENNGNVDDVAAFLMERYLPIDDVEAYNIAEYVLENPPTIGYLTISNALQWRLQYRRVIEMAGKVEGILKVL